MNLIKVEETTKRKTTWTQLSGIITNTVNKSEGRRELYWSLPFHLRFYFELSLGGGDSSVLSSSHSLPPSLVQSRIAIHHMPDRT